MGEREGEGKGGEGWPPVGESGSASDLQAKLVRPPGGPNASKA